MNDIAKAIRELEAERAKIHLEKMERFHLGVFELTRIEDLIVRLAYEFFGPDFIDVDMSKDGWEKKLTWDAMKDALNKRGQVAKQPCASVEGMPEAEYKKLMGLIRGYRTAEVVKLISYRDRRTHRVAPSVDHPQLAVKLVSSRRLSSGVVVCPIGSSKNVPEFTFEELYTTAREVYRQLREMLLGINMIIHC